MFFLIVFISFLVFLFLTKKFISKIKFYKLLIILQGFLWGSIGANFIIKFIDKCNYFNLDPSSIGFLIIDVFLEELIKFLIIYFIIGFFRNYISDLRLGFVIGGAVGFGFSLYENYLYYDKLSIPIWGMFYRLSVVSGLVHIFLSMLYGYVISNLNYIVSKNKYVFKSYKLKYYRPIDFFSLVKFIYINSRKSIKTILGFFYKLLILDVTLNYIFKNTKKPTTWGHSPVEVLVELFIFGFLIHLFYNISMDFGKGYINLYNSIIFFLIYIWLIRLVYLLVESKVITIFISLFLILYLIFYVLGYVSLSVKFVKIDVVFVIITLLYLVLLLERSKDN